MNLEVYLNREIESKVQNFVAFDLRERVLAVSTRESRLRIMKKTLFPVFNLMMDFKIRVDLNINEHY